MIDIGIRNDFDTNPQLCHLSLDVATGALLFSGQARHDFINQVLWEVVAPMPSHEQGPLHEMLFTLVLQRLNDHFTVTRH